MSASGIIPIDRAHPDARLVRRLCRHLLSGGLAVIPTETRYALVADATDSQALGTVRRLKGRGPKPFSVFLSGIEALPHWDISCEDNALRLAARFWPGPLTLILPTDNPIFRALGGGLSTVGVRVSSEPIIAALLRPLNRPLSATSANLSGRLTDSVEENRWLAKLAATGDVIWVRPSTYRRRTASTVIDCSRKKPRTLRKGTITEQAWTAVLRCGH